MIRTYYVVAAVLLFATLSGCNPAPSAVDTHPQTIDLAAALTQISGALNAASDQAEAEHKYTGLDICTATVVLTLGATGTGDNKLGVTIGVVPPIIPVTLGGNVSTEQTLVENRSNVITLNLVTPACNPTGTLGTVNPAKVVDLSKANAEVRNQGWTTFSNTSKK